MPDIRATVIIPTLQADSTLDECVQSLEAQSVSDFDVIVVDNSGESKASRIPSVQRRARVIENASNRGFGAAVNQGIRASNTPFVIALNDDATMRPGCIDALLRAAESRYEIGMCAPRILLRDDGRLDSAGMLLGRDGSSKQRGHLASPARFPKLQQVLLPSGCAALYRRDMLDEIGLFDERFFLYCEDTDLGLRARWKLWECLYVPDAEVEHRYSHSAGRASALKAYYVERNRLFVVAKNFPAPEAALAPLVSLARYFWHAVYLLRGRGKAAEHATGGGSALLLAWYIAKAHLAIFPELGRLFHDRRRIQGHGRMQPVQFRRMLASYGISARQVAAL